MIAKSYHQLALECMQGRTQNHKVLIAVLDGVGIGPSWSRPSHLAAEMGDAVAAARMPHLRRLMASPLSRTLFAHGPWVGLPSMDDMGNSEVGHNALGAGRVFAQGAKLVQEAIGSGQLFAAPGWRSVVEREPILSGKGTLHLCGLLSDGGVHSHIDHLFALITHAKTAGVARVRLHLLLDGRDVGPFTALTYAERLEGFLNSMCSESFDCAVASGGGRMHVTMDRYESDWSIVERGYNAHVLGEGRRFPSLQEAIEALRGHNQISDQYLPPFVIENSKGPVGIVEEGDSFVLFNFRGDRAVQFCRAMTEETFSAFVRKRWPKTHFAGMMQYDGDLLIPKNYLVEPPLIQGTLGERLAVSQVRQFACSETQKFGHVTYFWNGNRSGRFNANLEEYVEIPSLAGNFDAHPEMRAADITKKAINFLKSPGFAIGRINYANGDMVGHTGSFSAAVTALETVDAELGRLMQAAEETKTVLVVTADHGNADEMFELAKDRETVAKDAQGLPKVKTSHSLAQVPFALFNCDASGVAWKLAPLKEVGLSHVASTVLLLAGFHPPKDFDCPLIEATT